MASEPEAAGGIDGEVAARGELETAHRTIDTNLQQIFRDFYEDLVGVSGHAAYFLSQYNLEAIVANARQALEVSHPQRSIAGEGDEAGGSEGEVRDLVVVESVEAVESIFGREPEQAIGALSDGKNGEGVGIDAETVRRGEGREGEGQDGADEEGAQHLWLLFNFTSVCRLHPARGPTTRAAQAGGLRY